jgi:hypothetical protein
MTNVETRGTRSTPNVWVRNIFFMDIPSEDLHWIGAYILEVTLPALNKTRADCDTTAEAMLDFFIRNNGLF